MGLAVGWAVGPMGPWRKKVDAVGRVLSEACTLFPIVISEGKTVDLKRAHFGSSHNSFVWGKVIIMIMRCNDGPDCVDGEF